MRLWSSYCALALCTVWLSAHDAPALLSLQAKGLRFGLGSNSFVGADAEGVSARFDVIAGGFALLHLTRLPLGDVGLLVELLYARRGAEQEIQPGGEGYDIRYDLSYVELPVAIRLSRQVQQRLTATAHLGIAPALRVSGALEQRIPNAMPKKLDATLQTADVGLIGGIGIEMPLRRSARAYVDARVRIGLIPVLAEDFKPPLRENQPLRNLQNFFLGLVAGVGF